MVSYFVGFALSYLLHLVLYGGLLLTALAFWFMSPVPLWFSIAAVLAVFLPFLLLGALFGRKKVLNTKTPLTVLLVLFVIVGILAALIGDEYLLLFPTTYLGVALREIFHSRILQLLGNVLGALLAPLAWQLSWQRAARRQK